MRRVIKVGSMPAEGVCELCNLFILECVEVEVLHGLLCLVFCFENVNAV